MVWFVCDGCGDTIKKPKVSAHLRQCSAHTLTCVDCSTTFDRYSVHSHSSCVTEKEKYVDCVTKRNSQGVDPSTQKQPQEPMGIQFLSQGRPWKCSLCNIQCSDHSALMQHAQGTKHSRKLRGHNSAKVAEKEVQKGDNMENRAPHNTETSVKDQSCGPQPKKDGAKKKQKRKLQESESTDVPNAMEVAGSLDSKSRSEVDERNVKKCKKRSNKSAQKTLSPEHNGDVKVDITTMKSRTVIVDSSPHAISAEKIVRKTLMEVGGSCSAKKMREVLRSKLGMKKVKAILAEVQGRMNLKLVKKKLVLSS